MKGQWEYGVIGLGRFGTSVATTLYNLGYTVLGIDKDMTRVQHVSPLITHAVQTDSTDGDALRSLGFRNFDACVISVGPDLESSILATVLVKELGVKHIVAKATSAVHGKILERVGADLVVYPEREMGVRIAHRLVSPHIIDIVDLAEDISVLEFITTPPLVGKTLSELNLRKRFGITVLAIKRGQKTLSLVGAESRVEPGDILVVAGRTPELTKFTTRLASEQPNGE